MPKRSFAPGIFWTWQDRQVEDREHVAASVADMVRHGFGKLLVQPRGCRYAADDPDFIAAVAHAGEQAATRGAELWLHLDPRSMARGVARSGGAAEFLIVAGSGDDHREGPLGTRPLDVEAAVAADGRFGIRLDYPASRAYHVHSDGAIRFWPQRLERCLAYRVNGLGELESDTVQDVTPSAHLFTNEIAGYAEVFGRWRPPEPGDWRMLAAVSFASNYPDFASAATRRHLAATLDLYAAAGARLAGLWWDEPGYCTGFDRRFRADRGRIPWGDALLRLHRERTGRDALEDLPYLLRESDDGRWGLAREEYYRTVQHAVLTAQRELRDHARGLFGAGVRMGVHQTWHQNADDVINGCADWWQGSEVLEAGFTDVGDAERVGDPRQMAEVRAMAALAVSLGRHSASGEAYYNLWGVDYGERDGQPGGEIVDWWADLMAAVGCNWLAHTYGPTGYFERPSVWGPGYPDHPTWSRMPVATARLARALELAQGRSPRADVAFVYPLGALYRLGSDLANPLSDGAHVLIDALLRAGFELDVVSPRQLHEVVPGRYRAVLYTHPFGATPEDVAALERWQQHGARVVAHGLPPVAGEGYAGAADWRQLGLELPQLAWHELRAAEAGDELHLLGETWDGAATPGWGRPQWPAAPGPDGPAYLGLFLGSLGDRAVDLLARLGLTPAWRVPEGAVASRTQLEDGGLLLRLAPAELGRPFAGCLDLGDHALDVGPCSGLLALELRPDGGVGEVIAPDGVAWELRSRGGAA